MGIRFFCPNGHYLNVKSEYAGKVAFCKECKVQMRVPMTSMIEKGVKVYSPGMPTAERLDDAKPAPPPQRGVAPSPVASVVELVRNPDPIWEVIVPGSAMPYGPANGSELLEWIRQRRVGPETYVRRVDWKSKIEAKEVLPRDVFDQAKVDSVDYPEATDDGETFDATPVEPALGEGGVLPETSGESPDFDAALRRHKNASRLFYVVCSLVVALIVLAIALVTILLRNHAQ